MKSFNLKLKRIVMIAVLFFTFSNSTFAQGFLHASADSIVDGNNKNFVLRGIGIGGWWLQEGYMFNTAGFADQQYIMQQKIAALVGNFLMQNYYTDWRNKFVTHREVDSMAHWGFNSIRLPMHYNLFRKCFSNDPLQDEGFRLIDSLVKWCSNDGMRIILDMHATPGGQGTDYAIADINPNLPSLWASQANRDTLNKIWQNIAQKYSNNQTIGGYDLINEPNGTITSSSDLLAMYKRLTATIRTIDKNHIIFIEGNSFANDFSGLTPPWDNNMAYSFHKYWNATDQSSIQWVLDIRSNFKVPLWCGEFGENSNEWFARTTRLYEQNNIGWSNWPLKKYITINAPLGIKKNAGWERLLSYWNGQSAQPSVNEALADLQQMLNNLSIDSCFCYRDLIDAYVKQPRDTSLRPFASNTIPGTIYTTNYDFGSLGKAYNDNVYQTLTMNPWTTWNNGNAYRNDGVDIATCNDSATYTNGYYIGWIDKGEWTRYTVNVTATGIYNFSARIASAVVGGAFHAEIDGNDVTGIIYVPATGDNNLWKTVTISGIKLNQGKHQLTLRYDVGGFNITSVAWTGPTGETVVPFRLLSVKTDTLIGTFLTITLNQNIQLPLTVTPSDFQLSSNGTVLQISSVNINPNNPSQLIINLPTNLPTNTGYTLTYSGTSILSATSQVLPKFTNYVILNILPVRLSIPGKLEAESFGVNNGFVFEACSDIGGGQDAGYTDVNDYLEFYVVVNGSGNYQFNYRIAGNGGGGELAIMNNGVKTVLQNVTFPSTGGWQNWQTVTANANLPKGLLTLRFTATAAGFNLNYIDCFLISGIKDVKKKNKVIVAPNPGNGLFYLTLSDDLLNNTSIEVLTVQGAPVYKAWASNQINLQHLPKGIYFMRIRNGNEVVNEKIVIQ